MIRQAIIPLAGLGTRLLPLTSVYAKELLPINGKAGLEYIIEECIDAGIKEIIFIISKINQIQTIENNEMKTSIIYNEIKKINTIIIENNYTEYGIEEWWRSIFKHPFDNL